MSQIDASMTQVLLPRLERDFAAPLANVSWVAVCYLLTLASFTPIFGRLADMFGRKLFYMAGFLLFIIGSALCGLAPDLGTLIACRIAQAVGAALITANSTAIIVMATPAEEHGRGLGLQSAAQAIGLGAGPAIGGLLLDTLGWRWAFWVNVPVGLTAILLGWLVIPRTRAISNAGGFDWRGAILIAPALTAIVAALNQVHAWGPTSPLLIACLLAGVICLILFVRAERRAATPLLDPALFRAPSFVLGNAANFLSYAVLFGVFFVIPFALIRIYDLSELSSGLRLSILPAALGLVAPLGGALSDRFGVRLPACAGMLLCIAGLGLLYAFLDGSAAGLPFVMLGLAAFGAGQGLFISPNGSAIMAAAPTEMAGEAGSALNVARYMGISAGIAGASSLLAFSLGRTTGSTLGIATSQLASASRDVLLMLICLAAVAMLLSARPGLAQPPANT
ncbi:drug resistance transporter, EmrB/QacA subfamily [Enhydrobacter aerosaccus]|uniref:Drug resistance transporter, EmrB/QacA subfamily n=2 Tax=Enhydrobacter aerosaccus TaxID=225324 RepID=A0A1T4T6A9_9HYPH|nr:drug resistance transporter, EmrB/QacA subfamily [Enhydrobacter aerosaccus]